MRNAFLPIVSPNAPRQLSMALDSTKLQGITPVERRATILRLARLLMEAAGVEMGEHSDDER
jgi:hypothetical protein